MRRRFRRRRRKLEDGGQLDGSRGQGRDPEQEDRAAVPPFQALDEGVLLHCDDAFQLCRVAEIRPDQSGREGLSRDGPVRSPPPGERGSLRRRRKLAGYQQLHRFRPRGLAGHGDAYRRNERLSREPEEQAQFHGRPMFLVAGWAFDGTGQGRVPLQAHRGRQVRNGNDDLGRAGMVDQNGYDHR